VSSSSNSSSKEEEGREGECLRLGEEGMERHMGHYTM